MAMPDKRDVVGTILSYGVIVGLLYLLYQVFQPFLAPLAWASVIVVCFYPLHTRIEKRLGSVRGAAVSTLLVTFLLIGPGVTILGAFIREGADAVRAMEEAHSSGSTTSLIAAAEKAWSWIQAKLPAGFEFDLPTLLKETAQKVGSFLAARAGVVARNVALFLFNLFIVIFALFFLFRDASRIVDGMRRILPFSPQQRDEVLALARDLIYSSVTSSLIIAGIQGLLGGVLFAALGIRAPIFWGVMMAFFALLPMGGAAIIWVPTAIYLFVVGETVRGIILVAVGAGIISMVDNFLRPVLLSGKSPLNSLLIFISVLGGISVFGMLGIVLGPIVVATASTLLKAYSSGESGGSPRTAVLE